MRVLFGNNDGTARASGAVVFCFADPSSAVVLAVCF